MAKIKKEIKIEKREHIVTSKYSEISEIKGN